MQKRVGLLCVFDDFFLQLAIYRKFFHPVMGCWKRNAFCKILRIFDQAIEGDWLLRI